MIDNFVTDLSWLNVQEIGVPPKAISPTASSASKPKLPAKTITRGGVTFTIGRSPDSYVQRLVTMANKSPEAKKEIGLKISRSQKGKKRTSEHIENYKKSHTPERRAKISAQHKGKKLSIETRAKMSKAQKGRVVSDETRAKMSAKNGMSRPVMTPNGVFPSWAAVARAANRHSNTINDWRRKWPEHFYVID